MERLIDHDAYKEQATLSPEAYPMMGKIASINDPVGDKND